MAHPSSPDPHDLQRFVDAQAADYDRACQELVAGLKRTHWIWYIFPQMRGLGRSPTAQVYGIASRAEAVAYLAHPVLGPCLVHCTQLMLAVEGRPLDAIMPFPDNLKFVSSMTLFAATAPDPALFTAALDKFAAGQPDAATLELLRQS